MTVEGTDLDAETPDSPEDAVNVVAVGPGRPDASRGAGPTDPREETGPGHPLTSAEYSVAFSPRNLAIGLGIVAGVVAFLVSRRRSSGPRED